MARSDTVFTGSIPQTYDHNLGSLLFEPYARDIVRRIGDLTAGRVLETAAGTGIVTQALAGALPPAVEIVATDLNQPMLDHAATKPGTARVVFQQADAQALPFPDGSFDAVVCQFGIMFFPDRVAGMGEARRVLRPGGRFLFSTWGSVQDQPIVNEAVAALSRLWPEHPSWFLERVPSGYHDLARIRADLAAAGFESPAIETVRLMGRAANPRQPAVGFCQGSPLRSEIEALDPAGLEAATNAVAEAYARRFGPGPCDVPLVAHVIEVRR